MAACGATLVLVAWMIFAPGAPLNGPMPAPAPTFGPIPVSAPATPSAALPQPRWSTAVVPLILVCFLVPGVVYGWLTGAIRSQADLSKAFIGAMVSMAPVIALAFFAAQFIASFQFSQLDRMLAFAGGGMLVQSGLPIPLLLVGLIVLTMTVNLLMSSMSAKWTMLAPILVPMLMMVGISPELTQGAYRVGDSVTNIVTPLNSYAIVILAAMQRYRKDAGMGNLIALMVPYSLVFAAVWTLFLLAWVASGIPMGPDAPMWYAPGQ
jgi:aminobenzoyl-glutamate transport protein